MIAYETLIQEDDIHDKYRASTDKDLLLLVLIIVGFIAELYAVSVAMAGNVFAGAFIHFAVIAIAFAYSFFCAGRSLDARFPLIFAGATLLLGPLGAAGTLISLLYFYFVANHSLSFYEWFYSIFPKDERTTGEEVSEGLEFGRDEAAREYEVMSFYDIMKLGSVEQKREALIKMTQYFDPKFSPALHLAAEDNSNAIRVQAATVITKIKNQFYDRAVALTQLHHEKPSNADILHALASHYDDYAFTGLLDAEREDENREKALELYRKFIEMRPAHVQARQAVGRLLIRKGEAAEAAEWFEYCQREGHFTADMVVWYAESLFTLNRYEDLRHICSKYYDTLTRTENCPAEIIEAVKLWSDRRDEALRQKVSEVNYIKAKAA